MSTAPAASLSGAPGDAYVGEQLAEEFVNQPITERKTETDTLHEQVVAMRRQLDTCLELMNRFADRDKAITDMMNQLQELRAQPQATPAPPAAQAAPPETPQKILERCAEKARIELQDCGGGAGADEAPTWNLQEWIASTSLLEPIVDRILRPIQQDPELQRLQLPYIRALGKEPKAHEVLTAVMQDAQEQAVTRLACSAKELSEAGAVCGEEMHGKFVQESGTFEMAYADLSTFFAGLEGMVGSPNPRLEDAMKEEHCDSVDSSEIWVTGNYGIETSAQTEWWFVVDPEVGLAELSISSWPGETKNINFVESRADGRRPLSLQEFSDELKWKNSELLEMREPLLKREELIGARLYTGPMFEKYRRRLRRITAAPCLLDTPIIRWARA